MSHPARFSKAVIDVIAEVLQGYTSIHACSTTGIHIHDPFAGTGERLWELSQMLEPPASISGTEIEAEFIKNQAVSVGDATERSTYPDHPYVIVTSPTYPNGMADSWSAKDPSTRKTYRAALREINAGDDRQLHDNNQGRYGYRGTSQKSSKRRAYWDIAERSVVNWDGAQMALVNVSDFIWSRGGVDNVERVCDEWQALMERHGWKIEANIPVGTPRMGYGANRHKRVPVERVLVCSR